MERSINLSNLYSRNINVEFDGIPDTVDQNKLKSSVVKIKNAMGIDCIENIEACHRLRSKVVPKPTIIQTKRAIVEQIFEKRKKLAEVAIRAELPERTKVYVNNNLCPKLKDLAYNCRRLKRDHIISDTWSFNGEVKIKHLNRKIEEVSQELDLFKEFPEYQSFSFDTTFCKNSVSKDQEDIA